MYQYHELCHKGQLKTKAWNEHRSADYIPALQQHEKCAKNRPCATDRGKDSVSAQSALKLDLMAAEIAVRVANLNEECLLIETRCGHLAAATKDTDTTHVGWLYWGHVDC
jgi:hypothetical protein